MNTLRHYYIVPRDVAIAGARHVAESHWIDLDETHVLVSVRHRTEHDKAKFERNVTAEPLPEIGSTDTISNEHAGRLAHLGVRPGHTTKDVARKHGWCIAKCKNLRSSRLHADTGIRV
jgi:hypothetical protein